MTDQKPKMINPYWQHLYIRKMRKNEGDKIVMLSTLIGIAMLLVLAVQPASAIEISTCSNLDTDGATYYLNSTITNSSATQCMNITANNVTLDCQGYTVDGTDTAVTSGIYIHRASETNTNITVKNCRVTDWYHGIYLRYSSNNTITNNTANSNSQNGIYLYSASNNTITNNTANSNAYGICLYSSSNNTITNNTANSNMQGIYLDSSSNNDITNNTANSNAYGIYLDSSSNNDITNNTANSNAYGIYLDFSSDNTITNNTANSNAYGICLYYSSDNNELTDNAILFNVYDILILDSANTYFSNNQFLHNLYNTMLTFTEVSREINLSESVNFNISMFHPNGTACSGCSYNIITNPVEGSLAYTKSGNNITGNFTATKIGIYSLIINITDENNNTAKRNVLLFVNSTGSRVTKYYFRSDYSTHGQPSGNDAKSLLFTAPTGEEWWTCSVWIQNSPDELPNNPFSILKQVDMYTWYKTNAAGYFGIQRYGAYSMDVDKSADVPLSADYQWIERNITDINWSMDYSRSWYGLSLKFKGSNPTWKTNSTTPSYANFTYNYTTTPEIKSVSNDNIQLLSATSPADNTYTAAIVLEGTGTTNLTAQMPNTLINYTVKFDGSNCNDANCSFTQLNGELNFTLNLGSEHTLNIEGRNYVHTGTNEWHLLNNWYSTNETFGQIAANESNDLAYSHYNSTSGLWESYWVGYSINNNTVIDKHESVMGYFSASTTITCSVPVAENVSIPATTWYYTYLREYTAHTLSEIETSMTDCDIYEIYAFDNSTQDYNNTASYTVNPNEGFLVYANSSCVWDGSV